MIIATVFHFLARARLRQDIDSGRKEGFAAVATFASIELIVFLQEDTTTLMVWWQTGEALFCQPPPIAVTQPSSNTTRLAQACTTKAH